MDAKSLAEQALAATAPKPTVYKLAKRAGVKWETARDWVEGRRIPTGAHLLKLMQIAGKTLAGAGLISAALLTGHGEAYANNAIAAAGAATVVYYVKSYPPTTSANGRCGRSKETPIPTTRTWDEVWTWVKSVARLPRDSWRAAYYIEHWNVIDKKTAPPRSREPHTHAPKGMDTN